MWKKLLLAWCLTLAASGCGDLVLDIHFDDMPVYIQQLLVDHLGEE
jgi:hypothetical protein